MALQKLPSEIQSICCASTQICSYKRAIEELVYNSLDAESTSIAIRVNIEKNTIQVIDNGSGVSKRDLPLLGQRYATSKCVDQSTLKSAPDKYGFRGQSLASIIQVSQRVIITSKHLNSEETWVKTFIKGKEEDLVETSKRPSKGTTVEIKGFLYNLTIQRKATVVLKELSKIKQFLEQLSLVHNNASVSLRNDAKNEIILKIHKNRCIYQSLSTLFEINKEDMNELKVEKNEYKLIAYIEKRDRDINTNHWIYLNGKFLQNSKIHKVMDDNLVKSLKIKFQTHKKIKFKNNNDQEVNGSKIPCYFIFITCPYYDYDVNYTSKQSIVEFRNWEQVTKLIEKVAKFYVGDDNLMKEIKPVGNIKRINKNDDTRDKVKQIMEKILGSNHNKTGITQMQNGLKGKPTKRKFNKKILKQIPINVILANNGDIKESKKDIVMEIPESNHLVKSDLKFKKPSNKLENKKDRAKKTELLEESVRVPDGPVKSKTREQVHNKVESDMKLKKTGAGKQKLLKDMKNKSKHREHKLDIKKTKICTNKSKIRKTKNEKRKNNDKNKVKINSLLKKFKEDPTGSIKKRCDMLAEKVEKLMTYKKKRKRKIFVNEKVQYSNVIRNNKKYSIRQKYDEIVIHEYIPKTRRFSPIFAKKVWDNVEKMPNKSTYDLVQTILKTQEIVDQPRNTDNCSQDIPIYTRYKSSNVLFLPKLTYESHNYDIEWNEESHIHKIEYENNLKNKQFISTKSRENFAVPTNIRKTTLRNKSKKTFNLKCYEPYQKKLHEFSRKSNNSWQSSCTIEFTQSSGNYKSRDAYTGNLPPDTRKRWEPNETYEIHYNAPYSQSELISVTCPREPPENTFNIHNNATFSIYETNSNSIIEETNKDFIQYDDDRNSDITNNPFNAATRSKTEENKTNVLFISPSQDQVANIATSLNNFYPINICETVHSDESSDGNEKIGRKNNDSLFNDDFTFDSLLCDRNMYTQLEINYDNAGKNADEILRNSPAEIVNDCKLDSNNIDRVIGKTKAAPCSNEVIYPVVKPKNKATQNDDFQFKNRLRFVPKGMSQIFKNCRSKNDYDNNLESNYFEEAIYDKFAKNVENNLEIFIPGVQTVNELTTKAIEKVNNKLNKDNASLIFNGDSLKEVKVLGQVDNKFIAAKIKARTHQTLNAAEYLVVFDQHAVHERIRLENNLSDYFNDDRWRTIELDELNVKLSKDEILYMHNHKEKFLQLGLQWTITSNCELSINAIPEAILGKNPRHVDVVMKAVKNLIIEEVNSIKSQSGCINLYPKAIMDLVFSEACRYAIKFGDRLSQKECVDLLMSLSDCKTPFQCAHGRPVMAVLIEIKGATRKYETNQYKLRDWIKHTKLLSKFVR